MITITALAAFLGCVMAGAVVFLRMGIHREESDNSLLDKPATCAAAVTRRVVGLYVRAPRRATQADDVTERTDSAQGDRPTTTRPGR